MRANIHLFIILPLLFFACKNRPDTTKRENGIKNSAKSELIVNTNQDFSKSAESFARQILKENLRIHIFDSSQLHKPKHIHIFEGKGIKEIKAFSNINSPKKVDPSYYEHFTLFVATYASVSNAETTFKRIISDSYYEHSELDKLDEETRKRVKSLNIGAKPGGLITQNGRQIFSLVETCRATPVEGDWFEYENMFTDCITNKDGYIQVLKAGCGESRYYGGQRKVSSQQCL